MTEPCYFYVDYTGAKSPEEARVWPLCLECGQHWEGATFWAGEYGPWEYRCHNPLCKTPGGKVIWEGTVPSDLK